MGGLFSSSTPAPPPTPARPVTAVAKTPDLEMEDTKLASEQLGIKKKGKKALKTDLTTNIAQQTASTGAGLQIPSAKV